MISSHILNNKPSFGKGADNEELQAALNLFSTEDL
jgi:hypothetical protein